MDSLAASPFSTPPVHTPPPPSSVDFIKRRDKLYKDIEELYAKDKDGKPGQASYIKTKLDEKWAASSHPQVSIDLLQTMEANIAECKIAREKRTNVIRQRAEVAKAQAKPGEIDMGTVGREMEWKMGIGKKAWHSNFEEFGAQFYHPHEDKREILEQIKNHKESVVHTKPNTRETLWLPPVFNRRSYLNPMKLLPQRIAGYSRLLHEADVETSRAVLDNTLDLQSILQTGRPHPARKKMPYQEGFDALSEVAKMAVSGTGGLLKKAGKGMISKSDPQDNPNYKKYLQYRDAIVSDLLWKFNPDGSRHGKLMQQYAEILKKNVDKNGLLDPQSFADLMKLVEEEAKAANAGHEEQIKSMNEALNKLNTAMYEDVKEHTKDEDDMFKYRAFQVFLIASPFAGIMFMGPILGAFSTVFENADGIADGIASLCSPECTGIFGTIAQAMRIDDLIRWLLTDLPLVGDAMEVVDYVIGGDIVQTALGDAVLPLLAGPLVPLAIAGVYSIYRVSSEGEHYNKYHDSETGKFPKHKRALDAEIQKLRESLKDPDEIRAQKYKKEAEDLLDKTVDANLDKPKRDKVKKLLNFAQNMPQMEIVKARAALEQELKALGLKDKDVQTKLQLGVMNAFDTFHAGPNIEEFYEKKLKILENAHTNQFLSRFLMKASEAERTDPADIQTSLLAKLFAGNMLPPLMTCLENNELSEEKLAKFLSDEANKDFRDQVDKRVLYFISTADQDKTYDQMINETNAVFSDRAALKKLNDALKNEKLHRAQEFILGMAQERDIAYDKGIDVKPFDDQSRVTEVARVKEFLKQKEIADMKEMMNRGAGLVLSRDTEKVSKMMHPGTVPNIVKGLPTINVAKGLPAAKCGQKFSAANIVNGLSSAPQTIRAF